MKARQRKLQLQRRFRSVHGHWLCPCNFITGDTGAVVNRAGFIPAAKVLRLWPGTKVILPAALGPGGVIGKSK